MSPGKEAEMCKKILVVDDEVDIRAYLSAVLTKAGYETLTAVDGREAFEKATEHKPNLIILDLDMPRQTGTDFYRRLSKHAELSKIPIIVVSGLAGRHLALKQPFAVFDKPIDPEVFITTVERALGEDH